MVLIKMTKRQSLQNNTKRKSHTQKKNNIEKFRTRSKLKIELFILIIAHFELNIN